MFCHDLILIQFLVYLILKFQRIHLFVLLISFFFEKQSAPYAAKKAFLANRVGDFGFLLGISIQFLFDGVDKTKTRIGIGVFAVFLLLGAGLMFLVKEDLRKYNFEKEE